MSQPEDTLGIQIQTKGLDVLGIQIIRDRKNKMLALSQHGVHLSKEQCPKTPQEVKDMQHIPYASAIGSLMILGKSTSGSVFTLNGGVMVWHNIKQGYIVCFTMEDECVVACEVVKKVVWLIKFLHDLEVVPNMNLPITLYCDNNGIVANFKEPHSDK
ncbi:gag/pol protein [Cucumis melo var. makuwa]|uniref:Gag/pol protein n=1 Tax=Cucumis melo var. makuwa TaxID=1194695 RepID=A0A5A7SXZ1_CUCMM|nr:gag/pol protein [Cucumis melo var. makuwa]TYK31057.1 gag/pol protein [Cucumis melo var. makuwa]